jgi:hypothetical protein
MQNINLTTYNIHNYIGDIIKEKRMQISTKQRREKMNEIMINIAYNAYFSLYLSPFFRGEWRPQKTSRKNLLALPLNKTRTFLFWVIYTLFLCFPPAT